MADGGNGGGYSLSDLGGGTATQTSPGPAGGGGYSLSDLGGGGGGAAAPAAPTPSPAAPPAPAASTAKKSGGGFFGRLLSGAVSAVKNTPKGIGGFGSDVGKALVGGTENVANDIAFAATLGHMGGGNERHLGNLSQTPTGATGKLEPVLPVGSGPYGKSEMANYLTAHPYSGSLITGPVQTANEVRHPTQLAHDFSQNPVGTLLNTAATISIVGGPAAHVLAGAEELSGAAGLGGAAEKLAGASEAAGKVAAAPLKPFTAAGRLAGGALAATPIGGIVGEQAGRLSEAAQNSRLGQTVASLRETQAAKQAVGNIAEETQRIPVADMTARLRDEAKVVGRITPDPIEQGAAMLNAQGQFDVPGSAEAMSKILADPAARGVIEQRLAQQNRGLPPEFHVTPQMLETAARQRLGLTDTAATARLTAAEDFYRGTGAEHEARALVGFGTRPGDQPLSRSQVAGPVPLAGKVDQATAAPRLAAHDALQALRAARAEAGVPTPGAEDLLRGRTPNPANVPELTRAARLLSKPGSMGPAAYESLSQLAAEHGLRSPEQLPEYLAQTKAALGQTNPAGLSVAERAHQTAQTALDRAHTEAETSLANVPSAYRPALTRWSQMAKGMADEARAAAERGDTETAARLAEVAKDIEPLTKLEAFRGEGVQRPSYVKGANKPTITAALREEGAPKGRGTVARMAKSGSSFERKGNTFATTVKGHVDTYLREYATQARTEMTKAIADRLASPTRSVLDNAEGLKPAEMYAAGRAQGLEPWNPRNPSALVNAQDVTADTLWLPRAVAREVSSQFTDKGSSLGAVLGKGFDSLTRVLYKYPLQLSPHYWGLRLVGNTAMAAANDMSLGDIIHYGTEAAKMQAAGEVPGSLRGELLGSGRSAIARRLTTVPRVIDEMTKVALYLKNLDENGGDHAAAVRAADHALNGYGRMSPAEQSVLRRTFPVFSWARQVAATAAKLGEEHPAAVAFALHLGDIASTQGKNDQPSWVDQFNPVGFFTATPSALVNPLVRAGFGVATGANLSANRDITRPPGEPTGFGHPLKGMEALHFAEHTIMPGKLYQALTQKPVSRYDTGQPVLGKGTPTGGKPLPGGRLAQITKALGFYTPPAAKTPSAKAIKYQQSQGRLSRAYKERLAQYNAGG